MEGSELSGVITLGRRRALQRALLRWYDQHRRDLPWRRSREPYRVWLAEIMLQQTRVSAVTQYYEKFLQRFPTLETLARARLPAVLAAWSGLGYYRRARALHQAARQMVAGNAGRFPRTVDGLRELPGIGRYTAAAVASIAFGEPAAVVDGNVERVLRRMLGEPSQGKRELWAVAQGLLRRQRPGDFNQAMMELGATLCLPRQPECGLCPLRRWCATQGELPTGRRETRQKRQRHYRVACRNGAVFLVRRPAGVSLMPGMWELPEIRSFNNGGGKEWFRLRHSITVTDYQVSVSRGPRPRAAQGRWIKIRRLPELPLTGLTKKILSRANVI